MIDLNERDVQFCAGMCKRLNRVAKNIWTVKDVVRT